jgi:Fe-S cluster biogenesis protein NfuA
MQAPADDRTRREHDLSALIDLIRTEVSKDGGTVRLVEADYLTGVVKIELGGACGSCSLTGSTLEDGVKRILLQRLDWVTEVAGEVDESSSVEGLNGWTPKV